MATAAEVEATLDVLCQYYRDKNGEPRRLGDVQIAVYLDGLVEFSPEQLEAACRQWMRESKWFPALSELRGLLVPAVDWTTAAMLAWTTLERAISRAGVYAGATFEDAAIGETTRQTFGSWEHACAYDRDSPGWAIKRQTFLAIFPHLAQNLHSAEPVTLRGIAQLDRPALIAHVEGLPAPPKALPPGADKSRDVLSEVTRRFQQLAAKELV